MVGSSKSKRAAGDAGTCEARSKRRPSQLPAAGWICRRGSSDWRWWLLRRRVRALLSMKKAREKKSNNGVHMGGEGTFLRATKPAGLRRNGLHFRFSSRKPMGALITVRPML